MYELGLCSNINEQFYHGLLNAGKHYILHVNARRISGTKMDMSSVSSNCASSNFRRLDFNCLDAWTPPTKDGLWDPLSKSMGQKRDNVTEVISDEVSAPSSCFKFFEDIIDTRLYSNRWDYHHVVIPNMSLYIPFYNNHFCHLIKNLQVSSH